MSKQKQDSFHSASEARPCFTLAWT